MMTKRLLAIAVAIALAVPAARAVASEAHGLDPELALSALVAGNAAFKDGPLAARRVDTGLHGQNPKAIVLTCSDSRLPPEHIFSQGLGDLFVVRVAGNVPVSGAIGSMEYAAEHLGTRLLVVLGHRKCGAVAAAVENAPVTGDLAALVAKIKPIVHKAAAAGADAEHLLDASIELNAEEAAATLVRTSKVIRERVESGELRIVVAIYDVVTGALELKAFHE